MTQPTAQPQPSTKRSSADPTDPLAPHQPGELAPARAPGPGLENERVDRKVDAGEAAPEDDVEPVDEADVLAIEDADGFQAPETD